MRKFLWLLLLLFLPAQLFAYDATFNFQQTTPELVSGWKIKAGPTKGGPYPTVVDCGKPAPLADGTYSCEMTGVVFNPLYGVAVNYDKAKVESTPSNEGVLSITVAPPSNLKVVVTVRTVASLTRYGNPTAKTTVTRKSVPDGTVVKEGTSSYWNSKTREYITNTTIVSNG